MTYDEKIHVATIWLDYNRKFNLSETGIPPILREINQDFPKLMQDYNSKKRTQDIRFSIASLFAFIYLLTSGALSVIYIAETRGYLLPVIAAQTGWILGYMYHYKRKPPYFQQELIDYYDNNCKQKFEIPMFNTQSRSKMTLSAITCGVFYYLTGALMLEISN